METKPLFTTIATGKYKGKKILLPSLESTRSTKSILKGSFFDSLQNELIDELFVEVFGGSGSMGLEALSRGAKHAYFIEKDKAAYTVLQQNCASIDKEHTTALKGDSFNVLPSLFQSFTQKVIFYFDPPFSIREGMESIYEKTLHFIASIPSEKCSLIAIEHMSDLNLPDSIGSYTRIKNRKFGKSSLSYYV